jgi:acyl-CoA dehydrogenase
MTGDSQQLLSQTAERLFRDLSEERSLAFAGLWQKLEETGFKSLLVAESAGGFGGSFRDVALVLRLAGQFGLAAPLAEAMLASHLAHKAGFVLPEGLITVAPHVEGRLEGKLFSGTLRAVPWGESAVMVLAELGEQLLLLSCSAATQVTTRTNPAGEPRARLDFDDAAVELAPASGALLRLGAFSRSCLIAGALDGALARSIDYANARVQFGKPIGKFQAVQQVLAVFAEEAAAVNCAAEAAALALDTGDGHFEIACAKLRAGMAAAVGVATAHQVHGAIGFTAELGLHHLTRRLTAWSGEFGNERLWAEELGGMVAALGADQLWGELTRRSDPL